MKKSIFLFFAAILCATSAWAYDLAANQYVYFEKPADWSNVSLLLGHNSWSQGYNMTNITNTNLYRWQTVSWGGYTRYCFIDATGWGGEGKKPDDRKTYASHSTNVFTNQLIKYHLFTTAGSKSSHASSYATAVNRTQTIKVQLKDGSNWVDATLVPADLKASTYALTSATAAGAKSASLAKESTTVSATVDAAYSATVSLTCENVLDGYVFDGWYDANGNKITSYTVSDAHTVFARFIQSAEETNEVTVTYMCGTTSVATAIAEIVGVETEKSFTAPTVTGYKFTEWTIGTGITLKAGTTSDATISVVTKSASSDYTLIANYEEVIETIYFINTGKWNVVNLHRWNGTATATAWPGEAMPKTGEKIGEYDVHSFTAQQGAFKNVIFTNKNTGNDQTGDLEWTAGKYYINNYNGNSGWYTKAEAEELLVVPAVYETVYFVNNKNWTKVQIHAWKGSVNNGWPGQALTATGEKVEGFDVYSFEAAQGTYTNLIFNNKVGDAGVQSSNFVWTADKYYYMGAAENYAGGTKEEVAALVAPDPLATDVFLAGEMNNWNATANEFKKATAEATTASVTISLTANTYMFKIVAGDWLGNKGTMKRDDCAGWTFEKLDGGDETNCKIVADIAGDYTFTWDLTSKKLTVTYPELPTYNVTATVNPAETGSVEGAKEYKQGEQATLTAAPAEGYEFVNWTKGEEVVSTENPYKFTVTEDVALVANFKKSVVTITKSFELTPENVGNRLGRQTISVEDVDLGSVQLIIPGFSAEVSEYAEASLAIGDDEPLTATATYQNDTENNKEIYTAVATSTDGSKIYKFTFNVALPTIQNYELYAMGISATVESEEGLTTYYLKGNAILGEEYVPVEFMLDNSGYAEGTIGEVFAVGTGEAEQEGTSLYGAVLLQDESGNTYRIEFTAEVEQPEVEIVVKEEVNVALYNLTVDVQGTMAMVSAGTEELSFWLTLLQTENHYGDYMNDDFGNIWYGDEQLYAAYGEKHTYGVTDGKVNFVVSFITSPDAEGNVTKYNFTLYAGEKPSDPTALDNISIEGKAAKAIINGQLIIVKDGVQYNAQGAVIK